MDIKDILSIPNRYEYLTSLWGVASVIAVYFNGNKWGVLDVETVKQMGLVNTFQIKKCLS